MGRQTIPGGHPLFTPPHETLEVCQHERRPGTTVCLHCRHAARVAARARLKRLLLRGSAAAIVIATFIVAGALGATAIRDRVGGAPSAAPSRSGGAQARRRAADSAREVAVAPTVIPSGGPTSAPATATAVTTSPATPSPRPAPPITPVLSMGKTQFPDSVIAVRGDTDVVLSFDLTMVRTRRPEKFEQFVRATLPAIYGSAVKPALAKIPEGNLAAQGELLTELPSRGMRIPVGSGWMLRLFPETRPGQEGPLVVRYRVSVVPERD